MKPNKFLFVMDSEYQEYLINLSDSNKILRYWLDILESMTEDLRAEASDKDKLLTELADEDIDENLSGVKPYRFEALDGSDRLTSYLSEFVIFIECVSSEDINIVK